MKKRIEQIIKDYNHVIKGVDRSASNTDGRSYGGVLRAEKGKLQEDITEEIIKIAWAKVSKDESRLKINSKKHDIPIQDKYIKKMRDEKVRVHLAKNKSSYVYKLSVDKQVFIDDEFVIGVECKSYTESAMLKRILIDFSLLKTVFPHISCYLFQLESQLGGDYSELKKVTHGSKPSHTLMSYFPTVDLNIVTFLKGERSVENPIHKPGGFKPLERKSIEKAVSLLQKDLAKYAKK